MYQKHVTFFGTIKVVVWMNAKFFKVASSVNKLVESSDLPGLNHTSSICQPNLVRDMLFAFKLQKKLRVLATCLGERNVS